MGSFLGYVIVWYFFFAFLAFLYHYFKNTANSLDKGDRRIQNALRALAWPADAVSYISQKRNSRPPKGNGGGQHVVADDPSLTDVEWLRAAEDRYSRLVGDHYGSPDTIAKGGSQRLAHGDPGAALFFFQKAIDTLHSIYVVDLTGQGPTGWSRHPSADDTRIVERRLRWRRRRRVAGEWGGHVSVFLPWAARA